MQPSVSVIITAYNVERYIAQAVHSALAQEGVSLEVIVVDDASTDGTWAQLSAIDDPRLVKHRLPTNTGPGGARNAAIGLARGHWLAVLDGDDQFLPGRLARCLARAEQSSATLVVDQLRIHREADGHEQAMFTPAQLRADRPLTLEDFIAGNRTFTHGYTLGYLKPIIAAPLLAAYGIAYHPEIRIGEDYILMLELLVSGAVCVVEPTAGYRYTVRRGSISHRLRQEDVARIRASDAAFFGKYPVSDRAQRLQLQRLRNLETTYAFTQLVEALKQRKLRAVWNILRTRPTALCLLWLPLWARLKRLP